VWGGIRNPAPLDFPGTLLRGVVNVIVGLQLPPAPLLLPLQWNLTSRGSALSVVEKPGAFGGLPTPLFTPKALK
jgi:hypothetical protein